MTTIYLVLAYVDYEGSYPIKAFDTREGATAFEEQCQEYMKLRPTFDMNSTEDEAIAWGKRDDEWREAHPAGKDVGSPDGFTIMEYVLEIATKEAGHGHRQS